MPHIFKAAKTLHLNQDIPSMIASHSVSRNDSGQVVYAHVLTSVTNQHNWAAANGLGPRRL